MSEQIKRIKLSVEEPAGVDRHAWPITQGVPFAEGELERGAPVRMVDTDGRVLPTQSTCLATWSKDLKYVKWLLVDFQCDLAAGPGGCETTHGAKRWKHVRFLQSSDLTYEVTRDGEPFGKGEKSRGWASLCGSEASAFVAIRDFWQQYPKGYELTADGMDIQFWPESYDQPLVFSTPWKERAVYFNGYYGDPPARAASRDEATVKRILEEHPTAPLNLKSFDARTTDDILWIESMVDKYAPDRPASHNDTGIEDGTGAAKTHEFVMRFRAEPIGDEEAEALGVCVQEPVIAPADPAYMCSTRAARDLFGGPDPRFAELDTLLDGIVEGIAIESMHRSRLWGFWRFGNMCCSHSTGPGLAYIAHYHTDPVEGMRHVGPYNNEADDPCWGMWTQFLRTGKRRFFSVASGFSRAMGDVGICHAHPAKPEVVGLMHYHNAHQWTGEHSPSHTLNTPLFLHYYLTGDRRMREIGLEVADWAVRNQEKAGIISCRHGRLNREFTGPLVCVIEAYLDTWAVGYDDLARRSLNWLLRTQEKPGIFPISVFTRGERGNEAVIEPTDEPFSHSGIVYPIFYEGLRHFDSPLLRETILAEADFVIGRGGEGPVATACALAYEMTGDPMYAAFCKYLIEHYKHYAVTIVELTNNSIFSGIRNGYISVLKATVARAMDQDSQGFVKVEKRLEKRVGTERREHSGPPPIPPEQSLGIIEGYNG